MSFAFEDSQGLLSNMGNFLGSGTHRVLCEFCHEELNKEPGQAIFTAECSHSFHHSCAKNNVKRGNCRCPVCHCIWWNAPFTLNINTPMPPPPSTFSFKFPSSTYKINNPTTRFPSPFTSNVPTHSTSNTDPTKYPFSYSSYHRSSLLPTVNHKPSFSVPPSPSNLNDCDFHDDEPLPVASTLGTGNEKVAVKTFTEFPAIAASDSISSFSVLLNVRGPPLAVGDGQSRVPVDLVFVLDVSGSMWGEKLSLLKLATRFVIDHMLPCDRLSIVTFSTVARRILPLCRMTEEGRRDAKLAVDELRADDTTNIVGGLNMGAKVLEQRRVCNPVSSIILLSDGYDTVNGGGHGFSHGSISKTPEYLNLLAPSIFCGNRDTYGENKNHGERFPVHAFGVGNHDSVGMNAISDASGGTFSFLESAEIIPASFARCIGGLFSVVAQDVRLMVWSASPGIEIKCIPSGRHESEINAQKKQGTIHIGDLYAEEKKDFLVHLSVPVYSEAQMEEEGVVGKTPLLDVVCYYHDPLSNETVQVEVESVEIFRPRTALPRADGAVNLEVDRQKNRVRVAESIEKAKEMAEKGNMKQAQEVLTNSRTTLLASASAQSGDDLVNQLEAELREITARMANVDLYQQAGRPLLLAGLSAHTSQRATTLSHTMQQAAFGGSRAASYGRAAFGAQSAAGYGGAFGASSAAGYGGAFGASSSAAGFGGASFWNSGELSFGCAAAAPAPSAYDTPMMQRMVSKTKTLGK